MHVLFFVLLLLSVICFVIAAFQVRSTRVHVLSLGLAFWVAVPLIQALQKL